jgi:hypothetical protein
MERMLLRERQAADAAEAASEPDQVEVEAETDRVPNAVSDGMAGGEAGDAGLSAADKNNERG